MLKTTRLFARMLTLRRFALTSAGRSQRARRASAYQALKGISVVGCFCQNRRSVEIAITRIACKYAPMAGAGQPAHHPRGEPPPECEDHLIATKNRRLTRTTEPPILSPVNHL